VLFGGQDFWLICAAFYVADNVKLLGSGHLVLAERLDRRWMPVFPLYRYRLCGRALTVLNLLLPALAAVRMTWLTPEPFAPQVLRRSNRLLKFYGRQLAAFRVLSTVLFAMFFIAGPILTEYSGPGYALILILPLHLTSLLALIILLVRGRRCWRMSWRQVVVLTTECAVCPGIFVNICRNISLNYVRIPGDAVGYALAYGGLYAADNISIRLERCVDELNEHDELRSSDRAAMEVYRNHLMTVSGHG
jgi:hypothetical protein